MIKLNLGAGKSDFGNSWIHIDAASFDHIKGNDIFLNGWLDNSVDLIYSSHMLEYFSYQDASFLLSNWFNVLKPGGIIRLAVPNFDALIRVYQTSNNLLDIVGPLYGEMSLGDTYIYHRATYTKSLLTTLLSQAGFKHVREWDWRINPADDCAAAHWPHRSENIKNRKFDNDQILVSLNLEAVK